MGSRRKVFRSILLAGSALAGSLIIGLSPAAAQEKSYRLDLPAQSLGQSLMAFGTTTDQQIVFSDMLVKDRAAPPLQGDYTATQALAMLLQGSGLIAQRNADGVVMIARASDPQSGSAAGDGAEGTVQALIVTAQKREEQIQDVPIAISAFTEKSLQEQKIEGGFDLLKAIPNVTFSKNNFTSYNFSIRGIGTKAVSATTDPGVAVSFNNIALIQNRLFEQEYFDVERVEVLRGPQGTLYGRNATAGVINVISGKPNTHEFSGWVKGEVGNYHTKRVSAMVNVPLVEDKLAIRIAGALTDRAGYDYNSVTKNRVNGRDLWSARLTIGFNPTDHIRSNLIWERFNEDDNRSRTGKQLCYRDDGKLKVGQTDTRIQPDNGSDSISDPVFSAIMRPVLFSQGCKPGSLYDPQAFGTPNGFALPFVWAFITLQDAPGAFYPLGYDQNGNEKGLLDMKDPYGGMKQSPDLRTIASFRDPRYRARADLLELNFDIDLSDTLTFSSQTAYDKDTVYSFQDYNRFNTVPIFNDTHQITRGRPQPGEEVPGGGPSYEAEMAPGGIFCDPQLGCSNTLAGFDISQATARQFSQEFRLQSDFDGPINFSAGANYTRFQALVDYYVMYNLLSAFSMVFPFNGGPNNPGPDITKCYGGGYFIPTIYGPLDINDPMAMCPYIDPNPVESINGEGHNYFRSKNPYKLKSAAAFGELYWKPSDKLKITAGLRYTDDRKVFIPVPSQILMARGFAAGGSVNRGYPELPAIKQHWGEFTGRLGVDWKPDLSFTDQTMLYAFYSRGYKGGGANPPTPGFASEAETYAAMALEGYPPEAMEYYKERGVVPLLKLTGVEYAATFKPEFVNAFEVGAKNTLLGGALNFNTDVFFYDYKDYQVSQVRDRTAVNENFDAKVWGAEFETMFSPSRNLQIIGNLGYLDTSIGDGETSIDIMNRTQSNPNYVLVKPWVQLPSNCVVPVNIAEIWLQSYGGTAGYAGLCGGVGGLIAIVNSVFPVIDPNTGKRYTPMAVDENGKLLYPELNGGAGLSAQLGGNELPNSPHWTMNLGAQYGLEFTEGWRATIRADAYWQSQSWARVYNAVNDKLHGWYNANLSLWFENDDGLKIELYAKNILDKTPITDAFINSDDTALTTNVFVLDPRLIGLSIRKEF